MPLTAAVLLFCAGCSTSGGPVGLPSDGAAGVSTSTATQVTAGRAALAGSTSTFNPSTGAAPSAAGAGVQVPPPASGGTSGLSTAAAGRPADPASGANAAAAGRPADPASGASAAPATTAGSGASATPAQGTGTPAAGSGGQLATAGANAAGTAPSSSASFALTATNATPLSGGVLAFPATALPPMDQSPGFSWTGVPSQAQSLALVFRDVGSNPPPVKWIVWDISPSVTQLPANIPGDSPHPAPVPGATQLGSLGNQGYAGPCCTDHEYEWTLYALDMPMLQGTERLSTAQIRMNLILMHQVAATPPLLMRIMP